MSDMAFPVVNVGPESWHLVGLRYDGVIDQSKRRAAMAKNQPSTKRDVGGQPDKSKDKGEKGAAAKGQGKAPAAGAKGAKGSGGKK
jgi:hypothetical protein